MSETIDSTDRGELLAVVRATLLSIEPLKLTADRIQPESLLIDDLGLDSLKFVDLTVGLEDALQVEEFPMQAWVDTCIAREQPLTVEALMFACGQVRRGRGLAAGALSESASPR